MAPAQSRAAIRKPVISAAAVVRLFIHSRRCSVCPRVFRHVRTVVVPVRLSEKNVRIVVVQAIRRFAKRFRCPFRQVLITVRVFVSVAKENRENVAESVAGEDGLLPAELCYDGVHLNKAGCRQWLDYLRTHAVGEIPEAAETVAGDPAEAVWPPVDGETIEN